MFSSLNLRQTLEVSLLITMFFFVSTILDWLDGFKANSYLYILNTHNSVSLAPVFNTGQLSCRSQVRVPNACFGLFGPFVHWHTNLGLTTRGRY